jgi:hypothetical protein
MSNRSNSRKFALVEVKWTNDPASMPLPQGPQFAGTGYNKRDGIKGLFSVWIEFTDWAGHAQRSKTARLFALAKDMEFSLPQRGETFILTSGTTPVAECKVLDRGQTMAVKPTPPVDNC